MPCAVVRCGLLPQANLEGTNLSQAVLQGAIVSSARFDPNTNIEVSACACALRCNTLCCAVLYTHKQNIGCLHTCCLGSRPLRGLMSLGPCA